VAALFGEHSTQGSVLGFQFKVCGSPVSQCPKVVSLLGMDAGEFRFIGGEFFQRAPRFFDLDHVARMERSRSLSQVEWGKQGNRVGVLLIELNVVWMIPEHLQKFFAAPGVEHHEMSVAEILFCSPTVRGM